MIIATEQDHSQVGANEVGQWTTAEHRKATTIEGLEMGGDRYQSNSEILKFNSETKS